MSDAPRARTPLAHIGVEARFIETNGVRLHVVEAGPEDGPLLILLHGFPEFHYGWRYQIAPLADAGFRVLAPDQRGYSLSDHPAGVRAYDLNELGRDILGLIDAAGRKTAFLCGHDWGGLVAWHLALTAPERLERVAIFNAPHPAVMQKALGGNIAQILRSWYAISFQLPYLPERMLAANGCALLANALQSTSRKGVFHAGDLDLYREAWERGPQSSDLAPSQVPALEAMLHWYRAASFDRHAESEAIATPVLLLWGANDRFLGRELAGLSAARCENAWLVFFEQASHWVQHEFPREVNRHLLDFFEGASDVYTWKID